ncbi:DUF11 domain-containing protein [Marinicella sp. W31]|uniref:DUF11 domain-containing protein n=1 Tax=Marinicella sp. W31 TaxID=3023713 RepID=UPI0037566FE3
MLKFYRSIICITVLLCSTQLFAQSADLSISKDLVTAGPFGNGQNIFYTITVTNNGPDAATNVQVTDIPTNLDIIGVSSTNCNVSFPCSIPSLANGANEVISVSVRINGTGSFDNEASVSADETDPNNADNTDNTGNGDIIGLSADLLMSKTLITAAPYSNGQVVDYTVVVTNNGPDAASNIVITDTPANLTLATVSSPNCAAFPCTVPALAVGASETINVTATIGSSNFFSNGAAASGDEFDPDTSNNADNGIDGNNGGTVRLVSVPVSSWWGLCLLFVALMLVVRQQRRYLD